MQEKGSLLAGLTPSALSLLLAITVDPATQTEERCDRRIYLLRVNPGVKEMPGGMQQEFGTGAKMVKMAVGEAMCVKTDRSARHSIFYSHRHRPSHTPRCCLLR